MKTATVISMILALQISAHAQQSEKDPTVLKDKKGIVRTMEFTADGKSVSDQEFMKQYLKVIADDNFVKAKIKSRSSGAGKDDGPATEGGCSLHL